MPVRNPSAGSAGVDGVLVLASRPDRPLVTKLPRQSGMKEQRYAQLLGELPEAAPEGSAAPAPVGSITPT